MPIKTGKAKEYFDQNQFRMDDLKSRLIPMIESRIQDASIDYHGVSGRTKSLSSFLEKVERKNYDDLSQQMTDFCGLRVITYFPSQAIKIAEVLRKTFAIDEENSTDKADDLGDSRVGYQSLHLVCTLGKERQNLPEYSAISEFKFEIQIRTILQHAWAELAHDGSYKFSGELPPRLKRKLNLQAGVLELVDEQMEELSSSIKTYEKELKSSKRKLQAEGLNALSFERLFLNKVQRIKQDVREDQYAIAVKELRKFGINTISRLEELLDDTFLDKLKSFKTNTPLGFARLIMLNHDMDRYFSEVYGHAPTPWTRLDRSWYDFLADKHSPKDLNHWIDCFGINVDQEE